MRVALPVLDPVVGDIDGNASAIATAVADAVDADVVLCPELALCGYPPRDLLLREGFVSRCDDAVDRLAESIDPERLVLVGSPTRGADGLVHNALIALHRGRRVAVAAKRLMPEYDVFDEDRWFAPGPGPTVLEHLGRRIGLVICEDLWQGSDAQVETHWACDPVADVLADGCDLILAASASPWFEGKHARQRDRIVTLARRAGVPVATVNQAGANDDLIFGGDAMLCGADGGITLYRPPFATEDTIASIDGPRIAKPVLPEDDQQRCLALMTAVSGYVRKTGAPGVLVGLSGGIDSALTATIAVAALGADRVKGVCMPSRYSSDQSLAQAVALTESLGMSPPEIVPIESGHGALRGMLDASTVPVGDGDLTDQNLQARIRGVTLMAMSNATGRLVLATGNKSELAVGYATLYGDMCGALAVLGDVVKSTVWTMARWINAHPDEVGLPRAPIPVASIERVPTAELAPDQFDQDTLPSYDVLDAIIHHIVDYDRSVEDTAARTGYDRALVARWAGVIDRCEFKRQQAAVIPKIARRTFGPGRRWPIVAASTSR